MTSRHPLGLYILFFTEMWERFGFYCMLAIFKLYMDEHGEEHFLHKNSNQIYGIYLGGVYFTPFFGGILAEWKLGYRLTIIVGAIFLAAGYFLLGVAGVWFFVIGLGLIIVGNGLFKPNISTLVGKLYPPGDARVDSAFTIFYMGINVGAFTSPFVASYLQEHVSYHTAFAAAGVGMLISLAIFLICQRFVHEYRPADDRSATDGSPTTEIDPKVQSRRNLALAIFFAINILFWMAFKQNGNSFSIWFRDHTDRQPPAWMADVLQTTGLARIFLNREGTEFLKALQTAINPFYVIVLSPLLVLLWQRLRTIGKEPSTPAKLVLGFFLTAVAFGFMALAGRLGGDTGRVSMRYLFGGYALLTTAELCLSPMGLSLVSKLAHPRTRAIWMGGFFVSTAIGGYLSGAVGEFWNVMPHSSFFLLLAGSSLVAMVLMLASYRIIASAMPAKK